MSTQFELLVGSANFMHAFRAALETCRTSLYIQFSTFEGDASGQALADLLLEKVAQGVEVRLLLDYYSDVVMSDVYPFLLHKRHEVAEEFAQTRAILDHLRQQGVLLKRTAPPGFLGRFMLYRDHKKMIVIDGKTAFVGGINISDHNYAWHDFMVKLEGDLVADLVSDYCSSWAGQTLPLDTLPPSGEAVINQCAGRYAIFETILNLIDQAQTSIVIESPYLLGEQLQTALYKAAQRGVEITLILPYTSNKWIYRFWVRSFRQKLIHPQITIYGYQGEHGMTHAKLVLIDGRQASFGSFNLFELEGLTQKELNIFSTEPHLVEQLEAFIQADLAESAVLKPPQGAWGWWTYQGAYQFFLWWTNRLLKNPRWVARYC